MESVPAEHIEDVRVEQASLDTVVVTVAVPAAHGAPPRASAVTATVLDRGAKVAQMQGAAGAPMRIALPSPKLWSPDDAAPHLYDLEVRLGFGHTVAL
jgi:beta-galactosidase/beta-glucuronidase